MGDLIRRFRAVQLQEIGTQRLGDFPQARLVGIDDEGDDSRPSRAGPASSPARPGAT